ncbi:hypothetical protein ACIOGZ_28550 [Kitasatospora sp. NPDC088160]|uniref:hypothetical protein n=1 Tax=Kitasatospora sp. NPDC088160 TaxID=3364072 RepID=UPI00380D25E3
MTGKVPYHRATAPPRGPTGPVGARRGPAPHRVPATASSPRTPYQLPLSPGPYRVPGGARCLPVLVAGNRCPACGHRITADPAFVDLLSLTAHGWSIHQIADRWSTVPRQVDADLNRMIRDLGATGPAHAVDIAIRSGLLPRRVQPLVLRRRLTEGTLHALRATAAGLGPAEIGRRAGRTTRAVGMSISRFLDRYQLRSRAQAVRLLHDAHLLDHTHPCPCQNTPGTPTPT